MSDNKIRAVAQAAAPHAEQLVMAWLPGGKRKGDEWEACNPVRGDRTPGSFSVNLSSGAYYDFADPDAKGGDLVSLRAYLDGIRQGDAARAIDGELGLGLFQEGGAAKQDPAARARREEARKRHEQKRAQEEEDQRQIQAENATRAQREWDAAKPADPDHPYLTRKDVPAYNLRQEGRRLVVPLYHQGQLVNLERITANGDKRGMKGARKKGAYTLIGRLAVDATRVYVCEGWATGASLYRATDVPVVCAMTANNLALVASEIRAKFGPDIEILIAGDEDRDQENNPGRAAALKAAEKARGTALFPEKPAGIPESTKWDFNDLDVTLGDQGATLLEHAVAVETDKPDAAPIDGPEEQGSQEPQAQDRPFRALGYSDESYFYLPRGTEQVSVIGRGAHTSSSNMLALAPLDWWEAAYPKGGPSGGVDWQLAASDCMRQCEQAGVYDARNIRGRGAWYDSGSSVLHLGDRLIVSGQVRQIAEHQSRHIYTRQAPMESIIDAEPATDEEGRAVFNIIQELNWSQPHHGLLMAGFTLLAPICGALKWRPHVWLTSQRGAGKSYIQDNIVKPLLGQSALVVQGSTTEAGIRQSLKQDARPVMFDEAESEDAASQRRMKGVVELARQSSSDSSAEIAKGTVGGSSMTFRARSMFMMGSINVSLSSAADETRFSVLSLDPPKRTPEGIEQFGAFQREVVSTLNTERCAAIRARAYHLIPVIRQNADTMAQAVAERLGSQRIGDQVGTLLAGAIAMLDDKVVTLDEARAWVASLDLEDAQEAEAVSDELMCLQTILQHQVSIELGRGRSQRALSELVAGAAAKEPIAEDFYAADCNAVLERHGLKVAREALLVSNTHAEIKRILRDTPWGAGWNRLLKRIPGSESPLAPQRFAGTRTRSVRVPLSAVI